MSETYITPQMPASPASASDRPSRDGSQGGPASTSSSLGGPPSVGFWGTYRKSILTGLVALAVLTAGLLTYVLFFRGTGSSEQFQEDVELTLTAPSGTPSGAEMTYDVEIVNHANTTLTSVSLELIYPRGFSFIDSTPDKQDEAGRLFNFSDLSSNGTTRLTIVGRLEGNVQEIKTLVAKLHYIPQNFRSSFVAEASGQTEILAPDVSLAVAAPPELILGQNVEYVVKVTNLASEPFADLVLRLTLPSQFSVKSVVPQTQNEATEYAEWAVTRLDVQGVQEYRLTGSIFGEPGEQVFVTAELFHKSTDGELASAGRAFAFTKIKPSPLNLRHQLVNPPDPIVSGQNLNYVVNYENSGAVGLNNLVITVVFENPVFDFSSLKAPKGQLQGGNQLVWIPAQVPELLVVSPAERGSFEFSIEISDDLAQRLQKNPRAKTRVEYVARELGTPLTGNVLEPQIGTQPVVDASARIVAGASPLAIGQATTFEITFTATNSVNDLKDSVLLATVPSAQVSFGADTISPAEEQSKVQFVPIAGRIQWDLNRLFALTGTFHDARELRFQITVTPSPGSPTNMNNFVILRDIQITGVDEFTGKQVASNKINTLTLSGNR